MAEATLKFTREEREGIIPVGTYLSDAAARFGVRFEGKCIPSEKVHFCQVSVIEGQDHLSPRTAAEFESLADDPEAGDDRLACQAKVNKAGEILIMTKKKESTSSSAKEPEAKEYAKEFAELPLEKKFAELVQLEAIALGETFSFILNSPYLIFDKVMDAMADFGLKKEENGKKAGRPVEHVSSKEAAASDAESDPHSTKGSEDDVNT